eukprot:g1630.t1
MAALHGSLEGMFHKYKDGAGITVTGCQKFAVETGLLDDKLTVSEVQMIFAGVKLGKELNYDRFQEAVRKMAQKKEITYQELIQMASGAEDGRGKDARKLKVFWSHAWGNDEEGRDNHVRVVRMNDEVKRRGALDTWLDDQGDMKGNVLQAMTGGIDSCDLVIVCISKNYIAKVQSKVNDNCKLEFEYAYNRKGTQRMIVAMMEKACANPSSWAGPVGAALASQLYIDCSSGDVVTSTNELLDAIGNRALDLELRQEDDLDLGLLLPKEEVEGPIADLDLGLLLPKEETVMVAEAAAAENEQIQAQKNQIDAFFTGAVAGAALAASAVAVVGTSTAVVVASTAVVAIVALRTPLTMVLDVELPPPDSDARASLCTDARKSLSTALGVSPSQIVITGLFHGSTGVNFEVLNPTSLSAPQHPQQQQLICAANDGDTTDAAAEASRARDQREFQVSIYRRFQRQVQKVDSKLCRELRKRQGAAVQADRSMERTVSGLHARIEEAKARAGEQATAGERAAYEEKEGRACAELNRVVVEENGWTDDLTSIFQNAVHPNHRLKVQLEQRLKEKEEELQTAREEVQQQMQHLLRQQEEELKREKEEEQQARARAEEQAKEAEARMKEEQLARAKAEAQAKEAEARAAQLKAENDAAREKAEEAEKKLQEASDTRAQLQKAAAEAKAKTEEEVSRLRKRQQEAVAEAKAQLKQATAVQKQQAEEAEKKLQEASDTRAQELREQEEKWQAREMEHQRQMAVMEAQLQRAAAWLKEKEEELQAMMHHMQEMKKQSRRLWKKESLDSRHTGPPMTTAYIAPGSVAAFSTEELRQQLAWAREEQEELKREKEEEQQARARAEEYAKEAEARMKEEQQARAKAEAQAKEAEARAAQLKAKNDAAHP